MGLEYKFILWNRHKKIYDRYVLIGMVSYLLLFFGITLIFNPESTAETTIIRAFGTLAILMLHIVLSIGPLSRINPVFLPLLYNRRHLGVSMFLAAFIHGVFSIVQFHTLGNVNPVYSVFTSNLDYLSLTDFPFQVLGFLALIILFLMATTSHDFFLKNLSPGIWKSLHMSVYLAYSLIILHVFLGAFQQDTSGLMVGFVVLGFVVLVSLHLYAASLELKKDRTKIVSVKNSWVKLCSPEEIGENRAKIFTINKERVAVYKYDGKISAVHNRCKHQGGPLGEGKIVDGCITCPWHGYQYLPRNGQSPPPFTEKIATYQLKLIDETIYINPTAMAEGTEIEPINY